MCQSQNMSVSPWLPHLSVIIPLYNGAVDLPDLLNCLWAQTYRADRVEYLLVDNHSQDGTGALLQQAEVAAQQRGWTLRALSENQIQSSYAARNQGIRAATADILVFTDADCRPEPNWLTNLVSPFGDQAVGVVAGEIKALPGHTLLEQHAEQQETLSQKHTLAHAFCPYGQTANLAVRRPAFEAVGLFRPYLTTGFCNKLPGRCAGRRRRSSGTATAPPSPNCAVNGSGMAVLTVICMNYTALS
jgi:glycosyltransferase involved in cell wall biosynthesis